MCVGFSNGFRDFSPDQISDALDAMVPGSAISFDRVGLHHFAIYLGEAWPAEGEGGGQPIPLICHFSGDAPTDASVRLANFYDVTQQCTVRVYKCNCSSEKRLGIIQDSLAKVGEAGYNLVSNNCEHFVRRIIDNENFSYQSLWTFLVPVVQVPRLLVALLRHGSISSSANFVRGSRLMNFRSISLIDPMMNLMSFTLNNGGVAIDDVSHRAGCTRSVTGNCSHASQELYRCYTCEIHVDGSVYACKHCVVECHASCKTSRLLNIKRGVCNCKHTSPIEPCHNSPDWAEWPASAFKAVRSGMSKVWSGITFAWLRRNQV